MKLPQSQGDLATLDSSWDKVYLPQLVMALSLPCP